RRGDRDDMYDLFWKAPAPLVPRRLRFPVEERIRADAAVETPLAEEDVLRALELFAGEGVDSIAVAFVNAYANPEHELAAERILRAAGFAGDISLSHRVSGEYREYERTCTTVVDAFVRRRMSAYLKRLQDGLRGRGFGGRLLVTRSGGGAMTFAEAEQRPFETILSGPVAGANGAAALASQLGISRAISADVGGTSFDTCLIADGRAPLLYEGSVVGLPLQTAWVDVRTIGAGGGSIAHVDAGGLLRVGPRSAGADPGPASYGRGGVEPTTTDAALVLGMLGPGRLASGDGLDAPLARASLAPIREITVEQGEDPRAASLVAVGGAGPLFACLLADELGIERIVIPPHAGNFSAYGLLGSDLTQVVARTRILALADESLPAVEETLAELWGRLRPPAGEGARLEAQLNLRYVGQEYSLTIPFAVADGRIEGDAAGIRALFEQEYGRSFGHTIDEAVEIVTIRASAVTPLPPLRFTDSGPSSRDGAGAEERQAFSFSSGAWRTFAVV